MNWGLQLQFRDDISTTKLDVNCFPVWIKFFFFPEKVQHFRVNTDFDPTKIMNIYFLMCNTLVRKNKKNIVWFVWVLSTKGVILNTICEENINEAIQTRPLKMTILMPLMEIDEVFSFGPLQRGSGEGEMFIYICPFQMIPFFSTSARH